MCAPLHAHAHAFWCFFIQRDLNPANIFRAWGCFAFQSFIFLLRIKFAASDTLLNDTAISAKFTAYLPEPAIILWYNNGWENIEPYPGNWKMEDYIYQKVSDKWENKCLIGFYHYYLLFCTFYAFWFFEGQPLWVATSLTPPYTRYLHQVIHQSEVTSHMILVTTSSESHFTFHHLFA